MGLMTAWLAGATAGLAVAVPLGPVGVLIVDRGVQRGLRIALAAAAGVGVVDLAYGVVAVTSGSAVAAMVARVERPASLVAAGVLMVLGVRGLLVARRRSTAGATTEPLPTVGDRSGARTFLAFVGLTALNPATILTFAAIAVAAGERVTDGAQRAAFVLGVGLASLAWQAGLAMLGAVVGRRPRPSVLVTTRVVGSIALLVLAGLILVGATTAPG